jgi:hypothetical protein
MAFSIYFEEEVVLYFAIFYLLVKSVLVWRFSFENLLHP